MDFILKIWHQSILSQTGPALLGFCLTEGTSTITLTSEPGKMYLLEVNYEKPGVLVCVGFYNKI